LLVVLVVFLLHLLPRRLERLVSRGFKAALVGAVDSLDLEPQVATEPQVASQAAVGAVAADLTTVLHLVLVALVALA
jgi:hypothetical protein